MELQSTKPSSNDSTRTSLRGHSAARGSLEDVRESEEEYDEEDSPPPVKKPRPSLDNEDEGEEGEEEEPKPSRVRRAPARKAVASSSKRGTKAAVKDEEDDKDGIVSVKSESEDEAPPRRARGKAKKVADSDDDDFQDDDVKKPVRKARGSSVARATAPKATRGRRASTAPRSSGKRGTRASVAPEDEQREASQAPAEPIPTDDGNDSDALSYVSRDAPSKAPASSSKKTRIPSPVAEEPEEEERSLLDPNVPLTPIRSPRKSQVAPVIEEPQGPKSRLVIHKMALVNFKSYAGRQEIGPFHKVRAFAWRENN